MRLNECAQVVAGSESVVFFLGVKGVRSHSDVCLLAHLLFVCFVRVVAEEHIRKSCICCVVFSGTGCAL